MKFYKVEQFFLKMKKWLEKNKIFFETIVMASLTVMSISVAWNANKIADNANKLAEKEAAIEHNEKLPRFTMDNHGGMQTYNILNVGGSISDADAAFDYYVCIDACLGEKDETIVVRVIDAYEHYNVNYDYESHTFTNRANELQIHTMMKKIVELMNEVGIIVKYEIIDTAEIFYRDYMGEPHIERYSIESATKSYLSVLTDETYYSFMENYEFAIFASKEKTEEAISNSLYQLEKVILEKLE